VNQEEEKKAKLTDPGYEKEKEGGNLGEGKKRPRATASERSGGGEARVKFRQREKEWKGGT